MMLKKILVVIPVLLVAFFVARVSIVYIQQRAEFGYHKNFPKTIDLWSDDFQQGGFIPAECTGVGKNLSPSLHWGNLPQETKSIVLLMTDYDGPAPYMKLKTIDHWVVFNIPPSVASLGKASTSLLLTGDSISLGENITGGTEYVGPMPPLGTHTYYFRVYALSVPHISLVKPQKKALMGAMKKYILAYGELTGKFEK